MTDLPWTRSEQLFTLAELFGWRDLLWDNESLIGIPPQKIKRVVFPPSSQNALAFEWIFKQLQTQFAIDLSVETEGGSINVSAWEQSSDHSKLFLDASDGVDTLFEGALLTALKVLPGYPERKTKEELGFQEKLNSYLTEHGGQQVDPRQASLIQAFITLGA